MLRVPFCRADSKSGRCGCSSPGWRFLSFLLPLQIAVTASLPGLPLIFLVMPVGELLKLLAGALP